jgi:hypothetical protein
MKLPTALFVPLLCAAAVSPKEIDGAIDRARGVPGEFAADVMIRLSSVDNLNKARKIQLLEEAFLRASDAQQPYKRRPANSRLDLPGGFQARAFNQNLDALSLRLRAVQAMLPLDARKARDLFSQIPHPTPPAVKCEEFLVYDVSRFYDTAAAVASQGFSAKEVQQGQPTSLIQLHAGSMVSPVEAEPAARMLAAAGLKDDDFQSALAIYSNALGKITGDDRSFTYTLRALSRQVQALIEECDRRHVSPLPLIEQFRVYLVSNLSGVRCADSPAMQSTGPATISLENGKAQDQLGADAVAFFNEHLRLAPVGAIDGSEVAASKSEGTMTPLEACQDPECKAIQEQFQKVLLNDQGGTMQNTERENDPWLEKLRLLLTAMADWKESTGSTPAQHFRDKSGIYDLLFKLAPLGRPRDLVLEAMLDHLRQSRFQIENRAEWFLPANSLLTMVGLDPLGTGKLADRLRTASDPVVALYASVELLAPRTPDSVGGVL